MTQYALAYALTTTAGVRGVLALAAVAIAAHLGVLHPPDAFVWLGSVPVMWALIAVALLELLADKVPFLDHVLHFIQIAVKPAAAAIIVGGTVHAQSQEMLIFLMVIGALNALGVHAGVASARAGSTAATGGIANPVLSTAEDAGAIGASVASFFVPYIVATFALVLSIVLVIALKQAFTRGRAKTA